MQTIDMLTIPETVKKARTSRTVVYQAIKSVPLRAVKRGRKTLVLPVDLRDWVETLPAIDVKPAAPCEHRRRG